MTELQKEFEATGYTSCINADLYPDGKIYTQEYTQWLERLVLALPQPLVSGQVCDNCGEGNPTICQKCYDTESQFRESY